MAFPSSLPREELHRYHAVVSHSINVRSHFDALVWLQSDVQRYIPHDMLIAAWGNFDRGHIRYDIISPLAGVRTAEAGHDTLSPLLVDLFQRWIHFDRRAFTLHAGLQGFLTTKSDTESAIGRALMTMRSALVHGFVDERGSHDCLYVVLNQNMKMGDTVRSALVSMLPHIDMALRQIAHLPNQNAADTGADIASHRPVGADLKLSERELQVLQWAAQGKTNSEIASILNISAFTVKNHMQRVFQRLNVTNRAQAVSKLMPSSAANAQN